MIYAVEMVSDSMKHVRLCMDSGIQVILRIYRILGISMLVLLMGGIYELSR
jgi:hypothetical protein